MASDLHDRGCGGDLGEQRGGVDLYWIPLGAGARAVRVSGKLFEWISALVERRPPWDLYHSALVVVVPEGRFVIEMTPVADLNGEERGVVAEGSVGTRWAGRLRIFRYEIRRWPEGVIPDAAQAISSPVRVTDDLTRARRILDLVPSVPTPVWGRDELAAGDMWNSNSVTAWLLSRGGIATGRLHPPSGGRAPGWAAGLVVGARIDQRATAHVVNRSTEHTVGGLHFGGRRRAGVEMVNAETARPQDLFAQIRHVASDLPAFLTAPLYRRWHLRWGATSAEVGGSLPGDAILAHAKFNATRAITIDAPPNAVWPWLVQVGCLRAGWYSNDLLDNLGHPSATTIIPNLQHLEVGQWVPMSPTSSPSERTALKVHSFEVNKWLLWTKPDSTWAWQLTPTDDGETRLVTRIHAVYDWRHPLMAVLGVLLMEFGDFAMIRRMLQGIKARAESLNKNLGQQAA
jgi:hypothetical protein